MSNFDKIHRPLLRGLLNVEQVTVNRVAGAEKGKPPFHQIVELCFAFEEAMQEGLNSDYGLAMARDFQAFASGDVTILFCRSTVES